MLHTTLFLQFHVLHFKKTFQNATVCDQCHEFLCLHVHQADKEE